MTENADRPPAAAPRALPVRTVQVTGVVRLSPHMVRVTFGGPDLGDFALAGPDQQVKLYFPRAGQRVPRLPASGAAGPEQDVMRWYGALQAIPEAERPWARSYTIRSHDPVLGTVCVDFVLHGNGGDGGGTKGGSGAGEAGPATRWARSAAPGDVLGMFGPSAYFATPVPLGTTDWMLLAGDETALPAIGTIVEALPAGARAVVFAEVVDAAEEQRFGTAGDVTVHWLHRGRAPSGPQGPLVRAVRDAVFPEGSVHGWLGGEAGAVRALRRHLVEERGFDRRAVGFTGYWRRSLSQDDDPTEADLAEARERLADAGIAAEPSMSRKPANS
ncbi:siderophore-interacting protein [Streptomyces sp. NBC_01317]|uniref:siderophore-interacting protein n=1 Tax=Streptomyces sp. NBC_01317 TaxID=2903822 RepID=UPI002E11A503|nr:siderophore-interacting protein [Streptomyces sp. NBC_01317]